MNKVLNHLCAIFFLAYLSACASLSYTSPETVNFSGEWVLDEELSETVVLHARNLSKQSKSQGRGNGEGRRGQRGGTPTERGQRDSGTQASSPRFESPSAIEMKIDHVEDSMGILYQNGKYRDIDWGKVTKRSRTVTAGWKGKTLIVKIDGGRQTISEIYSLDESKNVLTITFNIGDKEYQRVYNRKVT